MKTVVSIILIIVGATLLALPLFLTFLLHTFGKQPAFDHFSEGQQVSCWVPGGFMLFIGIISSFFSRRS